MIFQLSKKSIDKNQQQNLSEMIIHTLKIKENIHTIKTKS